MQAAGVPIIPGTTDPVGSAEEVIALGEQIGYPLLIKAAAGRRRQGDEGRGLRRRGSAGVRVRATRRAVVLRRLVGLRRALPRRPAAHRGAGARGRARQRDPPRRARLHDPAPPPEAGRGDALARGHARAARPDRADRGRRGARGRLPLGGNDRRAAHARRRLLLHGDEHAHPGRAHRHRGGDRPRSRPRAGSHRGRRAAIAAPGGRRPARARDRVPHQRGGSVHRLLAHPRADHELPGAGGPGGARRLGRGGRLGGQRPLRPDDREADRARHGSRARAPADAARACRVRDRRREDAARLPPGAAHASVLHRRRDVSRPRRVRKSLRSVQSSSLIRQQR